jgi:HSP20 family protein
MALIKHSDWPSTLGGSLLSDFFDDDVFFNSKMGRRSLPSVNIKENEKSYELEMAVPGFNKKDFNISIDNNMLTVSAEKKEEQEKKEDNYTRREFGYESFSRAFNLPANTNEEDINARYEDGILRLSITKKTSTEGKVKKPIAIK